VRSVVIGVVLSLASTSQAAQNRPVEPRISVAFAIDGEPVPCNNLKVELRVDRRLIPVKMIDHGFIVPDLFKKLYDAPRSRRKNNIDIRVNCGEYYFEFPGEYPARILPGEWKLGIRYPQTWFEGRREEPAIEKGKWISVIDWECNECEPVVESTTTHTDLPTAVVDRLRREQSSAQGEKAMDIAYALAVFNIDYEKNREYLLSLLDICLSNPSKAPLDGICDDTKLYKFLANLYWRGDYKLLSTLLQTSDSHADVVDEDGYFYGDLLDRRTAEILRELDSLSTEKQKAVCRLAGKDDLSMDLPKEERVSKQLKAIGGESATCCLQEIEKTENWWLKKK